eukprot:g1434.t1
MLTVIVLGAERIEAMQQQMTLEEETNMFIFSDADVEVTLTQMPQQKDEGKPMKIEIDMGEVKGTVFLEGSQRAVGSGGFGQVYTISSADRALNFAVKIVKDYRERIDPDECKAAEILRRSDAFARFPDLLRIREVKVDDPAERSKQSTTRVLLMQKMRYNLYEAIQKKPKRWDPFVGRYLEHKLKSVVVHRDWRDIVAIMFMVDDVANQMKELNNVSPHLFYYLDIKSLNVMLDEGVESALPFPIVRLVDIGGALPDGPLDPTAGFNPSRDATYRCFGEQGDVVYSKTADEIKAVDCMSYQMMRALRTVTTVLFLFGGIGGVTAMNTVRGKETRSTAETIDFIFSNAEVSVTLIPRPAERPQGMRVEIDMGEEVKTVLHDTGFLDKGGFGHVYAVASEDGQLEFALKVNFKYKPNHHPDECGAIVQLRQGDAFHKFPDLLRMREVTIGGPVKRQGQVILMQRMQNNMLDVLDQKESLWYTFVERYLEHKRGSSAAAIDQDWKSIATIMFITDDVADQMMELNKIAPHEFYYLDLKTLNVMLDGVSGNVPPIVRLVDIGGALPNITPEGSSKAAFNRRRSSTYPCFGRRYVRHAETGKMGWQTHFYISNEQDAAECLSYQLGLLIADSMLTLSEGSANHDALRRDMEVLRWNSNEFEALNTKGVQTREPTDPIFTARIRVASMVRDVLIELGAPQYAVNAIADVIV